MTMGQEIPVTNTPYIETINELYDLFDGNKPMERFQTIVDLSDIPMYAVQQFYYRNRIPAHFWQRMMAACHRAGIPMTIMNLYEMSYPEGDKRLPTPREKVENRGSHKVFRSPGTE